jgi:hypothetical protein
MFLSGLIIGLIVSPFAIAGLKWCYDKIMYK